MYTYVQEKYLMTKTTPTPDVVDDDDDHYTTHRRFRHRRWDDEEDNHAVGVEESNQGPEWSRSHSCSSSSGGPTRNKQSLKTSPSNSSAARVLQL